ncbi:hypothetical protein GCM10007362_08920 [Saccharibacillus endophyticus]|uniref:Uncharacterized protein n=1 Tax=Saccharibacillus endophyticus TaxID=2060666 RepID=A0ABQ1ZQI2_9BACL|nr:hypothetical protein GCM10007362_08920 [Saccharibacillus endophyticus]
MRVLIVDSTTLQSYDFSYQALDVPCHPQKYDGFKVWIPVRGKQAVAYADYDFILYDTDDPFRVAELPLCELSACHRIWIEGAREPGEAYINEQFEAFPID